MNSSIKYQKSIDKLLDEVYLHYIQSTEFNGLPLSSVTSCSKDETKDVLQKLIEKVAKTEHSHPLGMVVSTHFRCGKWVKRGLKNGALPFNID